MNPSGTCAAIIVAAGSSRRMGFDKLAADLAGRSVLRRTVEKFLECDAIGSVILVCPQERLSCLDGIDAKKPLRRIDGGEDRQHSVAAGLAALDSAVRWVAVHDGARPMVSTADIERCVAAARTNRAASLARRVTETLKRSDEAGFCTEAVSRERLWFMETPQVFDAALLREAYAFVEQHRLTVTDEVSAIEATGRRVRFIESTSPNLKITTPADLVLATALLGPSI